MIGTTIGTGTANKGLLLVLGQLLRDSLINGAGLIFMIAGLIIVGINIKKIRTKVKLSGEQLYYLADMTLSILIITCIIILIPAERKWYVDLFLRLKNGF